MIKKILKSRVFNCLYYQFVVVMFFMAKNFFIQRFTRFGEISTPLLIVGILVESNSYLVFSYSLSTIRIHEQKVYERGLLLSIWGILTMPFLFFLYDYKLSSAIVFLIIDTYYLLNYTIKLLKFPREDELSSQSEDFLSKL